MLYVKGTSAPKFFDMEVFMCRRTLSLWRLLLNRAQLRPSEGPCDS